MSVKRFGDNCYGILQDKNDGYALMVENWGRSTYDLSFDFSSCENLVVRHTAPDAKSKDLKIDITTAPYTNVEVVSFKTVDPTKSYAISYNVTIEKDHSHDPPKITYVGTHICCVVHQTKEGYDVMVSNDGHRSAELTIDAAGSENLKMEYCIGVTNLGSHKAKMTVPPTKRNEELNFVRMVKLDGAHSVKFNYDLLSHDLVSEKDIPIRHHDAPKITYVGTHICCVVHQTTDGYDVMVSNYGQRSAELTIDAAGSENLKMEYCIGVTNMGSHKAKMTVPPTKRNEELSFVRMIKIDTAHSAKFNYDFFSHDV